MKSFAAMLAFLMAIPGAQDPSDPSDKTRKTAREFSGTGPSQKTSWSGTAIR